MSIVKRVLVPVLVALGLAVALTVWLRGGGRGATQDRAAEGGWFEDRTAAAGVQAAHRNHVFSNPYAEIMQGYTALGAAAAVADFDGDGLEDVFFTRSAAGATNLLYRNAGDFTFQEVGELVGVGAGNDERNATADALWLDFDNDGDSDLFVVRFGQSLLFASSGGVDGELPRFIERTAALGLGPRRLNSICAIAFDYDLDGDLDLFVGNYFSPVDLFDPETPRFFPESFESATNGGGVTVYRNQLAETGEAGFVDVTAQAGFGALSGWTLDLGHADADHDGDDDLYVAADFGSDAFFRNNGDGTFTDATREAIGIDTKKGMNAEWGDFDRDGRFDCYVTNITDEYMNEGNFLWSNRGGLRFSDVARESGSRDTGWGWAGKFLDYDNDGWLDLYVANGWVSGSTDPADNYVHDVFALIQRTDVDLTDARVWPPMGRKTLSGYQRNVLFRNDHGAFVDVAARHGLDSELDARGVAVADFDQDGRPDLFVTNAGKPPILWRNVQPTGRHWLRLELEGRESNRDAVGARVWIEAGGAAQVELVDGGNGFAGQSSRAVHFGVGAAAVVDRLVVVWPAGERQEVRDVPVDAGYRLVEGAQALERIEIRGGRRRILADAVPVARRDRATVAPPDLVARFAAAGPAEVEEAGRPRGPVPATAGGPAFATYGAGMTAFAGGDGDRALDLLEAALRAEPDNLRYGADYRQVVIALAGGERSKYDRALRFLDGLVAAHPESANARLNLAFAHVDVLPLEGAITQVIVANRAVGHFDAAIALEESWLARYSRGHALLFWPALFGRLPAAMADLDRAIELAAREPRRSYHARAWVAKGDAHFRGGDVAAARRTWETGQGLFPADAELAGRLERRGDELERYLESRFDSSRRIATDLSEIFDPDGGAGRTSAAPAPAPPRAAGGAAGGPRFEEVGEAAGTRFVHATRSFHGPRPQVLQMFTHGGAAVAVGDYDGDGDDDLFVTSSERGAANRLLRNDTVPGGPLRFHDATAQAGVGGGNEPHAIVADAVWLDYDGDGLLDLYVGRFGTPLLYRNLGRRDGEVRFAEVGRAVGLDRFANTIGTVAFDADGDGFLDLALANYFAANDLTRLESGRVLPNDLDRADNGGGLTFYRNVALPDGSRGFRDETARAGLGEHRGWSLDIGHGDLDDDGHQDLYVAGDFGTDRLFWGRGDGTFEDGTVAALGGHDTRKGMNVDLGDPDRDGRLDIYVTNITDDYMKECNFFWHNLGGRAFVDVAKENGTCDSDWGWAAKFGDFDNDGYEDLFVVNGLRSADRERNYLPLLLEQTILKPGVDFTDVDSYPDIGDMTWSGYQRQRLFHNLGDGTFAEMATAAGVANELDGRGIGVADFDGDGRLDFYQSNAAQPSLLYRGITPDAGNWLALRLVGSPSNREAIGARATLRVGGASLTRQVDGGNGYASASSRRLHFGLGRAERVDGLEIRWPSGRVETVAVPAINRALTVEEGRGVVE